MLHVAHLNNYKAVEDLGEGWLVWLAAPFLRSKKEKKKIVNIVAEMKGNMG